MHETAGSEEETQVIEPADVAESPNEFKQLQAQYEKLQEAWKPRGSRGNSSEIAKIDRQVREKELTREEAKVRKP